jgi:uncharacterized protein (TIGR01777 family)
MKILLCGCTGFIGGRLVKELALEGHDIVSLSRRKDVSKLFASPNVRYERWDGNDSGAILGLVEASDAVVNLAGESVAKGRWTNARKKVLTGSRVGPTSAIAAAIAAAKTKPKVLVNASAVGYYGNVDEGDVTEEHRPGGDFLATLCVQWEEAAKKASSTGVRVVRLRTGFVVGGRGSALDLMALPFRLFVGGPIGSGRQWLPWVHVADVTGAARYALTNDHLRGPVNVSAPQPARFKDFCAALGGALGRPSWAPVPGFVLRIALGELAGMVLGGQRAVPAALLAAGYRFKHPELREALLDALHESP